MLGRYIASASQVLVSALWRRYGLGSLAHRAGSAVASGSAWHRVCVAVVAHARYGHPLRFYITPHCPQCPPVAALKLRLVPVTASRPSGEGNRRYAKWPSLESVAQPSALPGRCTPYAPPSARPCGCRGVVASVRRCALCFGQWPAASHLVCAPAHPCASPLRGLSPARWSARPPPVGAPSARAPWLQVFATSLVASNAQNTGATGLAACKPA